jgi:hypothetical protein
MCHFSCGCIFTQVFEFCFLQFLEYRYPTKSQIQSLAKAIIRDYPFLKDKTVGSGYVSIIILTYVP